MFYESKNRNIMISQTRNFSFAQHLQHEMEIRICTAGSFDVSCNGIHRTLYPGDIMVAFPNDIHEYFESSPGEGYMLIFNPDISPVIKKLISDGKYENFISMKELIPFFEAMYSEHCNKASSAVIYGYVHIIAGKIINALPCAGANTREESDLLTKSLSFIAENYTSAITLNSVSKQIGVSHNHLSRLFSKKIHGGFCSYVNKLRIYHACELLKNTNLTIYEILFSSGFTNERTFYRVFRAETGLSPKEYRKTRQMLI